MSFDIDTDVKGIPSRRKEVIIPYIYNGKDTVYLDAVEVYGKGRYKREREGTPVLKLNTGNPAAFGFPLPESIRNAIEGREHEAVAYCDFQGMPAARILP